MKQEWMSDEEFDKIFDEKSTEINEQLESEILIAMIGDVNAGKSSTINRLMASEVAQVGAKPGETQEIKKFVYKDKIIFVDTPGLDDIYSEHSAETLKFYKQADVILFFLNAAGTVLSEAELLSLKKIAKVNKDLILVLNKIDAADDIPVLVKYVQDHTGYEYPVTPISSRTGENIHLLQKEVLTLLESKKKDILMAANMADKSTIANRWILGAGASAATIGAVPIPGSDFVPLTALQVSLMLKLSTLYGKPISKDNAKELIIATIVGNIGKTVFRQVIKIVPGAGMVAGASVAGAMTIALGQAVKYAHENDIDLTPKALKPIYNMFLKKASSQTKSRKEK
ncbi:50S ribosome-binding GTPase [Sporosarcina saromensis]|uniref:50S ribosome-binding GTPase n=1 Tax=Sporosarcina saromensis TaxID=359365 RepID=A0ABU4G4X5_9BACL|nr:GTPase [Sporosarcina saromensis]MDW0112020.1 50S ribosome-binding GTPase [Sporosarcina saromensis]